MTKMYRKTTCNGCGFTQETNLSYYLDRKQWQMSHPNYHWQKSLMGMLVSDKKVGNK